MIDCSLAIPENVELCSCFLSLSESSFFSFTAELPLSHRVDGVQRIISVTIFCSGDRFERNTPNVNLIQSRMVNCRVVWRSNKVRLHKTSIASVFRTCAAAMCISRDVLKSQRRGKYPVCAQYPGALAGVPVIWFISSHYPAVATSHLMHFFPSVFFLTVPICATWQREKKKKKNLATDTMKRWEQETLITQPGDNAIRKKNIFIFSGRLLWVTDASPQN